MRLAIYEAISGNNVLTRMCSSLASALNDRGVEAHLVSVGPVGTSDRIRRMLAELEPDHVVAFGSYGADFRSDDGASIYDAADCGFIGWDVDHPAYQFERFTAPIRRRVQVCASVSHVAYARMMGCEAVDCVMLPGVDAVEQAPAPLKDRPIPVAIAMSWLGEPTVWWNQARGTPVFALIEELAGRMLEDPAVDVLEAYRGAVADTGLEVRFDANINGLLANIALFVRQYDRLRLARTLAEQDVPVVICGTGWRERLGERPHLTYAEPTDFADLGALYGRSRVVLNLNAGNGASERAVLAMACGAAVVSDFSSLLKDHFEAHGALRFFDRRNPATVGDTLRSLLDGNVQAMADRGRALVAEQHLWSHRAARLIEVLAAV